MSYRLTYFLGEKCGKGKQSRLAGWGNSPEEAIRQLCRDPRAADYSDLRGYLRRSLGLQAAFEERPAPVAPRQMLGFVPDLHNVFKIIQSWPRGETVKFRAEAMAPEPEHVDGRRADLDVYFATNITRVRMPRDAKPKLLEFSAPTSIVSPEMRFFYRIDGNLQFYRSNDPTTGVDDFEASIPVEAVVFLLPSLQRD